MRLSQIFRQNINISMFTMIGISRAKGFVNLIHTSLS